MEAHSAFGILCFVSIGHSVLREITLPIAKTILHFGMTSFHFIRIQEGWKNHFKTEYEYINYCLKMSF